MHNKFIDLEQLFRSKNPGLLKIMPRFALRYLKKIIHEEDVNAFMHANKETDAFTFSENVIKKFNIRVVGKGLENIPREGGYVFCCNHPLGGLDAMALVTLMKPVRRDIRFVVNDLLLHLSNLRDIFTGVNKHGKTAGTSLKHVDELFKSELALFIFPAGLVSRRKGGRVRDLRWKKTFITRAKKYQKTIIPVFIDGCNSDFFYRLSHIRSLLGIKANIEMLYLVDEMYRQNNKTYHVIFGEPVSHESFTTDKSDQDWADVMKEKVYQLGILNRLIQD
jgi:putative hemolysin